MATLKQKMAASRLVENGGNVSKTMKEVGYSEETAKNPSKLTKSKSWQELMDEYLPEDLLAKKHVELLNKKEYIAIGKKGEREVLETGEIDPYAVGKALDMAYKLRLRYPKETIIIEHDIAKLTEDEVNKRIAELEAESSKSED